MSALDGDGETTFVAQGRSILVAAPGRPVALVHRARFEVFSLALAEPHGLFFATKRAVGYVAEPGRAYTFMNAANAELHVGGDSLYVEMPNRGVMRLKPIAAFRAFADTLAESAR